MAYLPIEDYAMIGDLHSVALIGIDGSIDFMCYPEFDSPTIFAALLDEHKGGRFSITPLMDGARRKQLYLPESSVLLTRCLSSTGVAEISDFMTVDMGGFHSNNLVRRAKTVRGEVQFRMLFEPRFNYARSGHRVEAVNEQETLFTSEGEDGLALRLRSCKPVRIVNGAAVAEFTLGAGETASFIMERVFEGETSLSSTGNYVTESFKETVNFWRHWLSRCNYTGRWREMVQRSAMILKLLTSRPHGSIIAAPTFGLPEEIGGSRNWDYRYTWIRDASFTLYALIRLGYTEEAGAFMRWIGERCCEQCDNPSLQIMYGLNGRKQLDEYTLDHLEGYRGSSPVRVGNQAFEQVQMDIYGELMDSVYLYNKYGQPIHHDLWCSLVRLIDYVCDHWRLQDHGIWEIRGEKRAFLYSRLMCWVAIDRGLRLAVKRSFPAPLERWNKVRSEIYEEIFNHFWDARRKAFVQYRGGSMMDAANLLMPLVRFISPADPRWLTTLKAIEEELVADSLVFRYQNEHDHHSLDGLSGTEGTFSMCTFWYVECLSRAGDFEKARLFFEKALGYANHVGLYGEQLGPSGEHLGNFPQAFTHLGLISTAFDLNRRLANAGQGAF